MDKTLPATPQENSLFGLLKPYRALIGLLVILTIGANALNLGVPKIISQAIDSFTQGTFIFSQMFVVFLSVAVGIFVLTYLQSLVQTYASERVAKDLRTQIAAQISKQEYAYIQKVTPAKLLTNLTSDVDSVKMFVSLAVASIISSGFLIIGASILLLLINWRLGLAVLVVVPIIAVSFSTVLRRVRKLFKKAQEAVDWLNKVINESILGAALIRLVNSNIPEYEKFLAANAAARDVGLSILRLFALLIPLIIFCTNVATLIILGYGGHLVINGSVSLGDFTAFNSYMAILIFPILVIGFMTNIIAQATASYQRISEVLNAKPHAHLGTRSAPLKGKVEARNIVLAYGQKQVLKDVSFTVNPGTKTAVIGPTAAGKTQLLYVLTGLIKPNAGIVAYDNENIDAYDKKSLHAQVAFVFQDSSMFNLTLRENIAFSKSVTDADLEKAIATAELSDFINTLPNKLDTIVSERGTSLSGGQKQRVMLARALALNPKVLLLDDFTARIDNNTERKILENISKNYPHLTLVSITQKIGPIEKYDQIVVLMEGEVLGSGTHEELMSTLPEYVQIYNSQQSTSRYELQA